MYSISINFFIQMHFPKDYLPNVRLLNSKSTQQRIENVQNLGNLYRMATEMTTTESLESLHLDRIIDLLIDFLKLHGTNEHICAQVIELVTIFQRAIQIKAKLFQRLKRTFLMMRTLKEIPSGITNSLHDQFVCVQRFTSCMDLDMVARKLASPRVRIQFYCVFQSIVISAPYSILAKHEKEAKNSCD